MALVAFPVEAISPQATREEVRGVIERLSEKTSCSAEAVFEGALLERAFERLEELETSEIALNRQISDLRKELTELSISLNRLEPMEMALRLDQLKANIFACREPATANLKSDLRVLKRRIEQLCFQFVFPETEELRRDSFQNNLLYRMEKEIANSDPETASFLKKRLASFKTQCRAAEEIFRGKGHRTYSLLPPSVRADIKGKLFEQFPDYPIEALFFESKGRIVAAGAIMASLGERMLSTSKEDASLEEGGRQSCTLDL